MKTGATTTKIETNVGRKRCSSARFGVLGLLSTIFATMPADGVFAFTTTSRATRSSSIICGNSCGSLLPRKRRISQSNTIHASATDNENENENDNDGDESDATVSTTPSTGTTSAVGLYKQYAEYASEQLLNTGWLKEDASVPENLSANQAPARGAKTESIVKITTKALVPTNDDDSDSDNKPLLRYARVTLLETVPLDSSSSSAEDSGDFISSSGIQVLNFVVLPNADTTLPVLGIDMVSLPGSTHLLLLDAQPMVEPNPYESHWEDWYNTHVRNDDATQEEEDEALKYAWGGDFPEAVQKYVSKNALWTRLQNFPEHKDGVETSSPAVDVIQGDLFVAFRAHLDAYLELVEQHTGNIGAVEGENHQPAYLDYRRNNDPAKPMLNRLYGPEWTQSLLDNVLFPKD